MSGPRKPPKGARTIRIVSLIDDVPRATPSPTWTQEEDDLLRRGYEIGGIAAATQGVSRRSRSAVINRVWRLGLRHKSRWSAEGESTMRREYARVPIRALARALGRTPQAVRAKASDMGISKRAAGVPWSPEEDAVLRDNYKAIGPLRLAEDMPGRTLCAIKVRASNLGITEKYHAWTPADDAALRRLYCPHNKEAVARELGRTVNAVSCRASAIGVTRPRRPRALALEATK